jgi:coenzyme F420 hydrogenase subunit beta
MSADLKGPQQLQSEVADKQLCTLCGACVGMCPYLVTHRGRVVVMDDCSVSEGRCYAFCPRVGVDLDELSQAVFGVPHVDAELGVVKEVLMARAGKDPSRERGQYGGTVSALMSFALREGLIDSAVLTSSDDELLPSGTVVRDEEGVLACAGSNFVASPTLAAFHGAAATEAERIGVVATPCQALALAKMKASSLKEGNPIDKLKLVVGLFCTWALRYEDFVAFLKERTQLSEIIKVDIPPPPAEVFEVHTNASCVRLPLDEVRRYIRATCDLCIDMTAQLADVSVGAAEGVEGWNTLIVRSRAGKELVDAAVADGALETTELPEENLEHLKEAALAKRKRALQGLVDKSGSREDLLYLNLSSEALERLLA